MAESVLVAIELGAVVRQAGSELAAAAWLLSLLGPRWGRRGKVWPPRPVSVQALAWAWKS